MSSIAARQNHPDLSRSEFPGLIQQAALGLRQDGFGYLGCIVKLVFQHLQKRRSGVLACSRSCTSWFISVTSLLVAYAVVSYASDKVTNGTIVIFLGPLR